MTVPSIIDDVLTSLSEEERNKAMGTLATLEFVAVGGGAINPSRAAILAQHNVKLLNHYGVTEIGAIAPIFRPGADYNWRYLRLRTDLGLQLKPIEGSAHFRLVGFPCGWDGAFEIQDELERNPDSERTEVRILGRTDDLIVLKTGEKVMPRKIEEALNADPVIKTSVCVGQGFFEVIVIIEPIKSDTDPELLKEHVWRLISDINPKLDQHARISSKEAIIIKPVSKTIPRSDKGSVMRREVHELFKQEIDAAYAAMESGLAGCSFELDTGDIQGSIRKMITSLTSNTSALETIDAGEDFFENGMDSMQAVRLVRLLNSAFRMKTPDGGNFEKVTPEFIYRNPSIRQLTTAVERTMDSTGIVNGMTACDKASEMIELANELISGMQRRHVILLTGATGNLGAHSLARMVRTGSVKKVICLVRDNQSIPGVHNGSENETGGKGQHLAGRLQASLSAAGIELTRDEWTRVEMLDLKLFQGSKSEDNSSLLDLAARVTHILHLAWPMDFNRTLQSFRPHLELVQSFINLSRTAHFTQPGRPRVRLLFASSIAVVRHFRSSIDGETSVDDHVPSVVPEVEMPDPQVAAPLGYAEAKWVCERILEHAGHEFGAELEPVVVRIGQISGPETTEGTWKTAEHIPKLVQASQKVGAFPLMNGAVSWLPVDRAANSLSEILLHDGRLDRYLHLESPIRQPMREISATMAHALQLPNPEGIPFDQWLEKARQVGSLQSLEQFFSDHFRDLAHGAVTLDTHKARLLSKQLRESTSVGENLLVRYIERWRKEGFLR
ncbi:putative secondary metabolism biosynthetic enzyme [Diatrype stigma]|uniref:Secondary metabolism biosynthetic enzyme n=1 Tax=Diatrype stigma TaxID=117547 RepID=A0AAN9UZS7_9PEZI